VLGVHSLDPARPDVEGAGDGSFVTLLGAPIEQVDQRHVDAEAGLNRRDRLLDGRWGRRLCVVADSIAKQRKGIAIVEDRALLAIRIDVDPEPIRTASFELHGALELNLLARHEHLVGAGL
jgi:hypothetical protein